MGRKHRARPIIYPKGVLVEVDCIKKDRADQIEGFVSSTVRLKNEKFERWLSGKHALEKGMVQCPKCQRFNNGLRRVCTYCNTMLPVLPAPSKPINQPINEKKSKRVETREEKVIRNRQETRFLSKKWKKGLRKTFERVC